MSINEYLFCLSATNQTCPSSCYWNRTIWNPPGHRHLHHYSPINIKSNILFAGDSTTRDTFYEFVHFMGGTVSGACIGNNHQKLCKRHVEIKKSNIYFNFLVKSNTKQELQNLRELKNITHAFIQCPIYEWYNINSYNKSKTFDERFNIKEFASKSIAHACGQYVSNVLFLWKNVKAFILTTPSLPGWIHSEQTAIINEINTEFGIECTENGLRYKNIYPIDRVQISSPRNRRRDAIHPTLECQKGIIETILSFL